MQIHDKPETQPTPTRGRQSRPDVRKPTPTTTKGQTMNATTTTKPAAKAKPAPKVSHAKAKAPELPTISAVKLVPLALIDVRPQVRTIFEEDSIQELASDIEARGLLQPVLLNPRGARFDLIAGERRLRACVKLGMSDIPALVTKASASDALLMQIAENVQRERLDLQDEVKAIRQLHDHLKTVQAVADTVKKSPAWVSKRLALSHPDFDWRATNLMQDGITEDVEILNLISHIGTISYRDGCEAERRIRAGETNRDELRAMLKQLKNPTPKEPDPAHIARQHQAAEEARKRERQIEADNRARTEGHGDEFVKWAWYKLSGTCMEPNEKRFETAEFWDKLNLKQRNALVDQFRKVMDEGTTRDLPQWAYFACSYSDDFDYLELMIGIAALKGANPAQDPRAFMIELETANR